MIKRDELSNPTSCMSRAREDEMTFVLLGRDAAASVAIRAWAAERIRLGKNTPDDGQIAEALACAAVMDPTETIPPEGGKSEAGKCGCPAVAERDQLRAELTARKAVDDELCAADERYRSMVDVARALVARRVQASRANPGSAV